MDQCTFLSIFLALGLAAVAGYAAWDKNRKAGILAQMAETVAALPNFHNAQHFYSPAGFTGIALDDRWGQVCFVWHVPEQARCYTTVLPYGAVLGNTILEDGSSVTTVSRGGQLGGAVVGALIAGPVGALIGGLSGGSRTVPKVSRIDLEVTVNDTRQPLYRVCFLETPRGGVGKDAALYRDAMAHARHWHAVLAAVIRQGQTSGPGLELELGE